MNNITPELKKALDDMVNFAIQRHQAGDIANAEKLYGKVLEHIPTHAAALLNLGIIYLDRGELSSAELLLQEAVKQNPHEATFHYNLALAFQRQGLLDQAEKYYSQALKLRPNDREVWENQAVVLQDLGRLDEALHANRQALRLDPKSRVANRNLCNVLRVLGRVDESLMQYEKAIQSTPLDCDIVFSYGETLLSIGEFSRGWRWYEWRYWSPETLNKSSPCQVPLPKWDGRDLTDRHLLVYGEQGIGDEIMFAACVSDVTKRARALTLLCAPRLTKLFARSFPGVRVAAIGPAGHVPTLDSTNDADFRISLASLPRFLRSSEKDFPQRPYLAADRLATEAWRERLARLGKQLTIGVSWRGGIDSRGRSARSVDLHTLQPIFERQDIAFVNVQYGSHQDEIDAFNQQVANPLICFPEVDPLRDMDGLASLLSALDLVISVDNSTVHLAGALGVPTWVMLPAHAEWRWLRGKENCLWYPTLRLFWQKKYGQSSWPEVVSRIRTALEQGPEKPRILDAPKVGGTIADECSSGRPLALLLNDTTYWYHWGCSSTSLALHEGLRSAGYRVDSVPVTIFNTLTPLPSSLSDFDDDDFYASFRAANENLISVLSACDLVFINGEGSVHGFGHAALALLYTAYICKSRLKKNTQIVNHSGYPRDAGVANGGLADAIYAKVYGALDFVAVREDYSLRELARIGVQATRSFDCLPLFVQRHPLEVSDRTKRVVIAGSAIATPAFMETMCFLAKEAIARGYEVQVLVGANAYLAQDDVQFINEMHIRLKGGYTLVDVFSEMEWLSVIAGAAVLISGRFHHTIAAACLGTPVLVASSNTHKIEGLLDRLQLTAEDVWLDTSLPQQSLQKLHQVLENPGCACVTPDTLAALRVMAGCNFAGLALS